MEGFKDGGKMSVPQRELYKLTGQQHGHRMVHGGYRTPIYVLNRIIRLQAVLEVIINKTTLAIDLLTTQQKQMRVVIYQNRLARDYLLADEGEACGKFSSSECCIKIDDNGDIIKNITSNIRKLAHVLVQKWTPLINTGWWEDSLKGKW